MARTALDDLIDIYREAQLALIKIIIGKTGAGTKTYYNSILKQTETLLNRLSAQTGRYINTEIPKAYKKALEETYAYFQKNGLQMNRPEMFAQIHSDAVSELAAEMQHHINEGISQAGRRVMRYADTARDNALRQNGLRASAVKIASGQTVRDMQKYLTQALSEDGFLTVQYGSGKYAYQVGLDSYAGLVARSTTREAGNLAREKQLTANGYDLVIITKHSPTCELCARVQGRVFSISGKDKRFPPLSEAFPSGYRNVHPNCRCVAVPWIEELQSPEELRAAIAKGSQPLKDERSAKEKALYTKEQAERRQLRADRLQFERYKARLGVDAPQTFSSFRRIKNEDGDRWESLQKEYRQRFESVHNSSLDNSKESDIIKAEDIYDLTQYDYIKHEELDEWKANASHCSDDEYNQIVGHRKTNGERGGYVRSHCAWEFNAKLRDSGEQSLDEDDRRTLETIRKLCKENVSDRNLILDRFVESDYLSEYSKPFDKYHENSIDEALAFVNSNMLHSHKTEMAIVSASYDANVLTDRSVHVRLFCPKGTHMFVTDNERESEVLFHDGLTYEIVSCEKESYKKVLSQKYRLVLNVVVKNNGL